MERFDVIPYTDLSSEDTWTRLGKGSFGCVYKGKYLGMTVAIKEVLHSTEYDVQKYFQRECKIMQEARHPNVVQYIGLSLAPPPPPQIINGQLHPSSPTQKRILIISEYLPRGNLRQYILSCPPPPTTLPFYRISENVRASNKYLKEDEEEDQDDEDYKPMPWRLRVSFAVDVARAVAYLHARGCMHRDLKGENLLVTDNERLKVCDFGFARLVAKSEFERKRITFCGTDGYMSPEILTGEEFGLETDIFSLGIIFAELLSRKLVDQHTFIRSPPSYALDSSEVQTLASPGCPPEFIRLALDCCNVIPNMRPNIRQVLERLRIVEEQVVKMENEVVSEANVGTQRFGGSTKKSVNGKNGRPNIGGRMPSFEGIVKPYTKRELRTSSELKEERESEMVDVSDYSTSVVKSKNGSILMSGSRISMRSNKGGAEEEETEGSNLTIKAKPVSPRPGLGNLDAALISGSKLDGNSQIISSRFSTTSSLPSIPSAWKKIPSESSTAGATEDMEIEELLAKQEEEYASRIPRQSEMGTINTVLSRDGMGLHSAEPSIAAATVNGSVYIDATPHPLSTVNERVSNIGASAKLEGGKGGEEGESEESRSVYVDAPSSSTETETEDEDPSPLPLPGQAASVARSPSTSFGHRFTIVRPTWKAVYNGYGHYPSTNVTGTKMENGNEKRNSAEGKRSSFPGVGFIGSVLSKCEFCGKRLGVLKEYLECDDCSYRCHVKCGEHVPRTCKSWDESQNDSQQQSSLSPPGSPASMEFPSSPTTISKKEKEGSRWRKVSNKKDRK